MKQKKKVTTNLRGGRGNDNGGRGKGRQGRVVGGTGAPSHYPVLPELGTYTSAQTKESKIF